MSKGRYGIHGGQYISETLMNELIHLEECYEPVSYTHLIPLYGGDTGRSSEPQFQCHRGTVLYP